ncbi:hypothetical protein KP509_03G000100 [Ceratopteris richardii]|uniref:Uncharacterized protein n=1 Tax=Ceratopteris richardii TaxID=49495 RepID=A0A8T2V0R1_CERRI|nr:hypothetical protein KP509_03G000100 [Ceratopteris richardii]KAH7440569.1 hypothetical protein KP509_03G000100 [Ceratopteris richardii]
MAFDEDIEVLSLQNDNSKEVDAKASVLMELIVDKLSLLDYENKFCNARKPPWPRLHKFYFSMQCSSQNEQFSYFVNLVSWLLSLLGRKFVGPREQMDLNATCTDIVLHLKDLGFAQPSWGASKLKQGFGDAVCSVLDSLTDLVLEAHNFQFSEPIYNHEIAFDEDIEVLSLQNDNSKEMCFLSDTKQFLNEAKDTANYQEVLEISSSFKEKHDAGMDLYTDSKMKAEHLACQSRVTMGSDGRDWRMHLKEAEQLHHKLSQSFSNCCAELQKVEEDISFCLDKLESKEKFLTKQLDLLLKDYTATKDRLLNVEQRHKQSLENVTILNNKLAHTSDHIKKVKHVLMEKGNKISDVSPLMEMTNSVANLKIEIQEMEVRIGVLEHTLLKLKVREGVKGWTSTIKFIFYRVCK